VQAFFVHAVEAKEPLPVAVDEVHAVDRRGVQRDRVGEADRLEDPHHLTVEIGGPGRGVHAAVPIECGDPQPANAEQVREGGTHRPEPDDRRVHVQLPGRVGRWQLVDLAHAGQGVMRDERNVGCGAHSG